MWCFANSPPLAPPCSRSSLTTILYNSSTSTTKEKGIVLEILLAISAFDPNIFRQFCLYSNSRTELKFVKKEGGKEVSERALKKTRIPASERSEFSSKRSEQQKAKSEQVASSVAMLARFARKP